jgi:hypothetical protein
MANGLEANADGLRMAAANSHAISTALTGPATDGMASGRPSSAGIAAVDSSNTSARRRQSSRISGQADDLSTGADRYEDTDGGTAENVAVTV